jgi:heat shock protein HtpX
MLDLRKTPAGNLRRFLLRITKVAFIIVSSIWRGGAPDDWRMGAAEVYCLSGSGDFSFPDMSLPAALSPLARMSAGPPAVGWAARADAGAAASARSAPQWSGSAGVARPRALADLQRRLNRSTNERQSVRVVTGMVFLLALCGWVSGGDAGAQRAVHGSLPVPGASPVSADFMWRCFGAYALSPRQLPELFRLLESICRRAQLDRLPDLYVLPHAEMNAYALGGPEGSAIAFTAGLLAGMTDAEVAAILAHEVAHIRNDDGWAMRLAAEMHRAITLASLTAALSMPPASGRGAAAGHPLARLLAAAPMLSQLLCLALSRIRELDADALALELTDDPHTLVAALEKLEHHHSQAHPMPIAFVQDDWSALLRSHPTTWQRVSILQALGRLG